MSDAVASPKQGSALLAVVGLCLAPLLVVVDSLIAAQGGWRPASAGAFGLLAFAAGAAVVIVALAALLIGPLRRALRRRTTECLVLGVASVVAVVVADRALAHLWPRAPFHCRTPDTTYVYEPYLFQMPGASATAKVTFNSQGVRGPEMPPRDQAYRILCVGGSTTECLFIDDAATWPALLATLAPQVEGRPVWVGAAAVGEFGLAEHVRFVRTSPLVGDVDCLVMLVGANDLVRSLLQLDVEGTPPPVWLRSNLIETARYVWNGRLGAGYYYDHDGQKLRLRRLGRTIRPHELDIGQMARAYGERLRQLIAAAKERNVRLVLVTQPVLWDDLLGPESQLQLWLTRTEPTPREWAELNAGTCRQAMDAYNAELVKVARETGTALVDAAPPLTGWSENFMDDYHLSRRGCRRLAELIAPALSPSTAAAGEQAP